MKRATASVGLRCRPFHGLGALFCGLSWDLRPKALFCRPLCGLRPKSFHIARCRELTPQLPPAFAGSNRLTGVCRRSA